MRVNKKSLEELSRQPPPTKRLILWDDKLTGFGVRCSVGGKFSYVVQFRIRGEPQLIMRTIGDYPAMPPDEAREIAEDLRSAALRGRDLDADAKKNAADARRLAVPLAARGLPFLVLSGYSPAQQPAAFRAGPYLQKPAHPDQVIKLLQQILSTTRS